MKSISCVGAAMALLVSVAAADAAPEKLWETTGLSAPESALPDPGGTFAYVSNVGGNPTDKDGNGVISKISLSDGKIMEQAWAKGLNGPKGLALVKDKLYASDIDQLAEIDTKTGAILNRYDAPGAKFLNDVAADADGNVYVSDSDTSTIWRLSGGKLEKWMEGPELRYPNGLFIDGDKMIIAAWGEPRPNTTPAFANLVEVSIKNKTAKDLGDGTPIGNLDGIERYDAHGFLVTDWVAGALYLIDTSGHAKQVLDLDQGSADIGYIPDKHLLLIPMMKSDKLVAYKVE